MIHENEKSTLTFQLNMNTICLPVFDMAILSQWMHFVNFSAARRSNIYSNNTTWNRWRISYDIERYEGRKYKHESDWAKGQIHKGNW